MSELTRDDVLDIMLECDPHVCCSCPLESQKYECYEIKESALNSLRDDYNAEVEKNKRLESELAKVAAERDAEWLNFIGDYSTAKCSTCGELYDVSEYQDKEHFNAFKSFYKFCPNCGANMDVEDKP